MKGTKIPDGDHPWRRGPIVDPRRPKVPTPISRRGRPLKREIIFSGTLEQCRLLDSIMDGFEEGVNIRFEIERVREDPPDGQGGGE